MKEYIVKSLPIAEVMQNLSDETGSQYLQKCNYHRLTISPDIGQGTITGIQFDAGFALLNYDCCFYEDTRIKFTFEQVHPIKFIHCYAGGATHYFEGQDQAHLLDTYENIVIASKRQHGHVLEFKANSVAKLCSVELDRKSFYEKKFCLLEAESGSIVQAIKDFEAANQYYKKGRYNLAISNTIKKLINMDRVTLHSILLKEGQSYMILAYQWMEFSAVGNRTILKKHEFETFLNIKNHIEKNIGDTITLETLSKTFMIGDKKIQTLFKTFTNKTVSKYVQNYRLEQSLELLSNVENNISEVVYKLGLKNRSYFTKSFKAKYGVTPSNYVEEVINR